METGLGDRPIQRLIDQFGRSLYNHGGADAFGIVGDLGSHCAGMSKGFLIVRHGGGAFVLDDLGDNLVETTDPVAERSELGRELFLALFVLGDEIGHSRAPFLEHGGERFLEDLEE